MEGDRCFDLHPRLGCYCCCATDSVGGGDGETLADTSHRAGCLQRSDGRGVVIDLVWPLLLLLVVVSTSKPKGMQLTFVVVAARQAADKGAVRYKM